jgi:hypothetical protein
MSLNQRKKEVTATAAATLYSYTSCNNQQQKTLMQK